MSAVVCDIVDWRVVRQRRAALETIERLFQKGVLRESRKTPRGYRPEGGGRPTEVYDLTKRDTFDEIMRPGPWRGDAA